MERRKQFSMPKMQDLRRLAWFALIVLSKLSIENRMRDEGLEMLVDSSDSVIDVIQSLIDNIILVHSHNTALGEKKKEISFKLVRD